MNQLNLQKRLLKLTDAMMEKYGEFAGKPSEPALIITVSNDLTWSAEIYSYILDFEDGGRHHFFSEDTYDKLISVLDAAITREEGKL